MSRLTLAFINKQIELSEKHLQEWKSRDAGDPINSTQVLILNRELNILHVLRELAFEVHGLAEVRIGGGEVETQPDR